MIFINVFELKSFDINDIAVPVAEAGFSYTGYKYGPDDVSYTTKVSPITCASVFAGRFVILTLEAKLRF